jgi:hypothetical protein
METNVEKATLPQVKYLHGLYRQLNWDEEMYRSMLHHNYGVKSTSDLTKGQAFNFIINLQKIVKQLDDRVSDKQVYLIRQLWKVIDYSDGKEGDVHLNVFLKKYYHKSTLPALTKQEGIKLIKQIGQMTKQAEARKGKTTVLKKRTHCTFCGELIMWVELSDRRREAFNCDQDGKATDFHKCK